MHLAIGLAIVAFDRKGEKSYFAFSGYMPYGRPIGSVRTKRNSPWEQMSPYGVINIRNSNRKLLSKVAPLSHFKPYSNQIRSTLVKDNDVYFSQSKYCGGIRMYLHNQLHKIRSLCIIVVNAHPLHLLRRH